MIELKLDRLLVSFPELPLKPKLLIEFQRTLRIPDDGRDYPLPPGLGLFPLRHIDDFASRIPQPWLKRGGVLMPMWQSEALWLRFFPDQIIGRDSPYPFAVKAATGKINAVTGESWRPGLSRNPQDYLVAPGQPWLDGYCVDKGVIRQFVAMPLGEGFSVEEQLTGKAEFGGLQIEIFPMRADVFERRFPVRPQRRRQDFYADVQTLCREAAGALEEPVGPMGLAPGGKMRQEIFEDPFSIHDWDVERSSRCFVHLVNSRTWQAITGQTPPSRPPTAKDYTRAGYPWFDYYDQELKALSGAQTLAGLKSVNEKWQTKTDSPLSDNQSVEVRNLVGLRAGLARGQVREAENW